MSNSELQAQIDAASAYQMIMVPALFQDWTDPVLDAAAVGPGLTLLDVACGTGVLASAGSRRVGARGAVTGIDLNPGMLSVARKLNGEVDWRQGPAEELPFADESFDAVVSQFGLMFFQDRSAAIGEMLRVLKPGGALAVAVWDTLENSPAYAIEVEVIERIAGSRAANALRAPFVLGDAAELIALFTEAGASSPKVVSSSVPARFPSVQVMVRADLLGWLPVMGVTLRQDRIDQILAEAERELAPFVQPNGEIVFDSPAHIVVAAARG